MKKLITTFSFFISFIVANAQIPDSGLVAYYTFNGSTLDSSGTGNNAIAGGCSFTEDRFGIINSALSFNGISDSLVMPIQGYTPVTGDFTISFWAKTSSPEAMNMFSLKDFPGDTAQNFEVQFNSNSSLQVVLELYYASFIYWNGSGFANSYLAEGSSGKYYNGQWQHFMVRRIADTIQMWHNLYNSTPYVGSDLGSGPLGSALPFITSAMPHRFKGAMDDIAFYNRALNQSEMEQLHFDQKPFEFSSPLATDAYVQGDTATIWWRWNDLAVSDSVLLEYRLNGGNWMLTDQNQLVDWTPYYLPLNYPPGTTIEVRVSDKLNPLSTASTGTFRVSEYAWEIVTPTLPFTFRDGSGLLNFNGKMWLLGGWDPPYHYPTYTINEVWNSDDGITWNFVGNAPWPPRHCGGWLVHDSAMWVIGGDPQSGNLTDVWKTTDGVNWIQIHDTIPGFEPMRSMHMLASLKGNIYNFGGQEPIYDNSALNQVWRSADGENWTQLPDAPWSGRSMVINSCVDDNDTLWLLGGGRLWDRRCYNEVWKTGDGIDWELVNAAAPWQSRYWHNVAWYDDKMWVLCGVSNQTNSAETWYSSNGKEWYELKNPKYADRHAASATVFDNYLWLMCGIGSNDVWRLKNTTYTYVDELDLEAHSFSIYPNPASGSFVISKNENCIRYEIYNSLGEKIQENTLNQSKNSESISLNSKKGIFLITVYNSDGSSSSKKLIIL